MPKKPSNGRRQCENRSSTRGKKHMAAASNDAIREIAKTLRRNVNAKTLG